MIMGELQCGFSQRLKGEQLVEDAAFDYYSFYLSLGFHLRLWRDAP